MMCCAVLSCSIVADPLRTHGRQPTRLLCPWDSPGKNTEVGCHALLQGIFPTQGSNLRLMSSALAGKFFTSSAIWETLLNGCCSQKRHTL